MKSKKNRFLKFVQVLSDFATQVADTWEASKIPPPAELPSAPKQPRREKPEGNQRWGSVQRDDTRPTPRPKPKDEQKNEIQPAFNRDFNRNDRQESYEEEDEPTSYRSAQPTRAPQQSREHTSPPLVKKPPPVVFTEPLRKKEASPIAEIPQPKKVRLEDEVKPAHQAKAKAEIQPEPAPQPIVPIEPSITFEELGVIPAILEALQSEGYKHPSPIQAQAIPIALSGRDLLGCAQTGTGKTAAFSIPILQRISEDDPTLPGRSNGIRALIITPTRELAIQIGDSIEKYGKNLHLKCSVIYGGVNQNVQTNLLREQPNILVATPGRLLDLMGQGFIRLRSVGVLVLDEADRMLDMGFLPDVKKIIAEIPSQRQTLFFSATMPSDIQGLADTILNDPVKVEVARVSSTAENIEQSVCFVSKRDKSALLRHLLKNKGMTRTIVFTRTKHAANQLCHVLNDAGIQADAIHSDKSQSARLEALEAFKAGTLRVLVASDIASRGIDVDSVSHVVNYDLPHDAETYVHRIGRTGRGNAKGSSISFCEPGETPFLKDIEKLTKKALRVFSDQPFHVDHIEEASGDSGGSTGPAARGSSRPRSPKPRR